MTDCVVIGVGAGGAATALAAADEGLKVVVTSKTGDIFDSSTAQAQGGIIGHGLDDSPELLARDIIATGDGLCDPGAVGVLAHEGPALVEELLVKRLGVEFSRSETGDLDLTQEAAHSTRRILHADDATGRAVAKPLIQALRKHPNVSLLTDRTAVDLITIPHHSLDPLDRYQPNRCLGAYILDNSRGVIGRVFAAATVLATGGFGQIYQHTTNPRVVRGDGVAMAARAGAEIINLEYVQFHPTALYHRDAEGFLISESLRGEGAVLRTRRGDLFMRQYHPLADLAPRDVVARAIHQEMLKNGDPYVLLDLSDLQVNPRERFPTIYETCASFGIDITRQPIPVVPAAHYACGGVKVDLHGRTAIERLYGVGEVSCTGLHGANRLASTSLLEALLWGRRAGLDIARRGLAADKAPYDHVASWHDAGLTEKVDPALIIQDWSAIKSTMWNYAGIVRTRKRLDRAVADLNYLEHRIEQFYRETKLSDSVVGLRNAIQVALMLTDAARRNPESRGCHYRLD
ncbi:MAG: L-aspartate oxidase [Armatimonadota bacterium]|nr:MAG: L-aspartate oxidase [Armatimonadota bacterium]